MFAKYFFFTFLRKHLSISLFYILSSLSLRISGEIVFPKFLTLQMPHVRVIFWINNVIFLLNHYNNLDFKRTIVSNQSAGREMSHRIFLFFEPQNGLQIAYFWLLIGPKKILVFFDKKPIENRFFDHACIILRPAG